MSLHADLGCTTAVKFWRFCPRQSQGVVVVWTRVFYKSRKSLSSLLRSYPDFDTPSLQLILLLVFYLKCLKYALENSCTQFSAHLICRKLRTPGAGTRPVWWKWILVARWNTSSSWPRPWQTWGSSTMIKSNSTRKRWSRPTWPRWSSNFSWGFFFFNIMNPFSYP